MTEEERLQELKRMVKSMLDDGLDGSRILDTVEDLVWDYDPAE